MDMRTWYARGAFAALLVWLVGSAVTPAGAVEDGLMGARIGASYREVIRKFGQPLGMLVSTGGGMVYQSMPSFSSSLPAFGQAATAPGTLPRWAEPVRVAGLLTGQQEWVYDLRHSRGVSLGIVLSGEGSDAVVTDVVVCGYPEYLKGKKQYAVTERGVTLQSTYATVLKRYGFPPEAEALTPGATPAASATGVGGAGARMGGGAAGGRGGGGMRAGGGGGGGMRGGMGGGGGMRGGGGGGMRGGGGGRMRGAITPQTQLASTLGGPSSFRVELTQMQGGRGMRGGGMGGGGGMRGGMGGGGGMRGGMGGGGGMRGGMRGGTMGRASAGTLPPLGTAAAGAAGALSNLAATATVDNQAIGFSRDCVLTYYAVAFTLHDMRVIRIHVSE
jgi:hypothetical protein